MGSLIAQAQADKVEGMVNRALEAKAELVIGGTRPDRPGAYFEPTIIANPTSPPRSSRTRCSAPS